MTNLDPPQLVKYKGCGAHGYNGDAAKYDPWCLTCNRLPAPAQPNLTKGQRAAKRQRRLELEEERKAKKNPRRL